MVSAHDREILRSLAAQVRQIADDPSMPARRERWRAHNALRSERPMVLCFPEGAWGELLPQSACQCQDPQLRGWEWSLRSKVYWWEHIRDDNTVEPYFDVHWRIDAGDYGVQVPFVHGDNRGSYVWDPPIKDLERDFAKLQSRRFTIDRAATQRDLELANDLFGDLLPPRIRGNIWWTVGLTQTLAYLVGLEQIMLAMYDQPPALHRLMAFLRDDMLAFIRWTEREGLLTPRNESDYVGSGGVAWTDELPAPTDRPVGLRDVWGFGESQETVGVSPAMFADFILPYQVPLLEHFGLNCYGCCEGLEHRIDVVLRQVPRLRRVSVAPLANQAVLAEKLGGKYVFSRKADPVPVCVDFNEDAIRADLRQTLRLAAGQPLELILKDTHTVQNQPWRVTRWVELAREEVERRA